MSNRNLQLILAETANERLGGAPHGDWVAKNRDILMMQVRNTTDRNACVSKLESVRNFLSVFFPAERVMVTVRAFAVLVLMVGTVFGGGLVSVMACRNAVPGESAYRVKLAVERAQVVMAPNNVYRIRLHAEFADRRMDEAAKLAEGPEDGRRLVVGVLGEFNDELADLRGGLMRMKAVDPEGVAAAAKLLERKMVSYRQVLKDITGALPSDVRPQALAMAGRVEGLGLQAMAVLVDQHLSGDVNASKDMVAGKINDRIRQAEAKLTVAPDREPTERTVRAKAAIAQAREMMEAENYQAAFSKIVEVTEITDNIDSGDLVIDGIDPEGGDETENEETETADEEPVDSEGNEDEKENEPGS
ncbi:hypothetical protein JW899_00395 [Candidatus Uhrbacteria bacterium]|nr:hypothetical protein [Candidatus Uhrbacteria bacterium]